MKIKNTRSSKILMKNRHEQRFLKQKKSKTGSVFFLFYLIKRYLFISFDDKSEKKTGINDKCICVWLFFLIISSIQQKMTM